MMEQVELPKKRTSFAWKIIDWLSESRGEKRKYENKTASILISSYCVAIALYHILAVSFWPQEDPQLHRTIHLGSLLVLGFLLFTARKEKPGRMESFFDFLLVLLALGVTLFYVWNIPTMIDRGAVIFPLSNTELVIGIVMILLVLEAARRIIGPPLGVVILFFLALAYFGPYLPGKWAHPGFDLRELISIADGSYIGGLWGVTIEISATYIILFLIFGKFLLFSGVGDLLIKLAYAISGRTRGGPAKIAVIGSGFMGMVTGGPISNVATVGTFTIPMMKRAGYPAHIAGAIEAVASTGASIMPPVMTGVIFLTVELTGISLLKIMVAAFLPAVLYYAGLFFMVHLTALREGLKPTEAADIPRIKDLVKDLYLLFPLVVLVGIMAIGYDPIISVLWATASIVFISMFRKKTRMGLGKIFRALEGGVLDTLTIVFAMALAGIIAVTLFKSGLDGQIVNLIYQASQGSLFLALLVAGIAAIILGCGIPLIAVYIILVLVIVPAAMEAGVSKLAAHLFTLHFGNTAFITPPVCLASYAAAAIAQSDFMKVGIAGMRFGVVAFVVPFGFIYKPDLLILGGSLAGILYAFTTTLFGSLLMSCGMVGWISKKLSWPMRLVLFTLGALLFFSNVWGNVAGVALGGILVIWETRKEVALLFERFMGARRSQTAK
jgi:TRAP transporter 4TM/12TM fusion protein